MTGKLKFNPENIEVRHEDGTTVLSIAPDGTITHTVVGAFPRGVKGLHPREVISRAIATMQGCLLTCAESVKVVDRKMRERDFSDTEPPKELS
jgi:hypothetical protein